MNLFRGRLSVGEMLPFPKVLKEEQTQRLQEMVGPTAKFLESEVDAAKNDLQGKFDEKVLSMLGELGVYGLQAPEIYNGSGLNNTEYARLVTLVGHSDLSLGVHLGAHQSIGYKGILLYGTEKQKAKYVPDLAAGKKFAAYCLTEPDSGSDVSSIQAKAELSPDGKHYILNGTKVWISNGGLADIFTVFAKVPVENVLGPVGEGFKIAVNILNQGRFSMSAVLSGTMREVIKQTLQYTSQRKQFGRTLNEFQNVQEKLTNMAIRQYVTEAMAYILSGMMDLGAKDFQVEAAMSKIYSSESAWYCVDEAIQIHGGTGYMKDTNLERILRDLRVFRIFEGANDILRLFISLTGLNYAGKHLAARAQSPFGAVGLAADRCKRVVGLGGSGSSLTKLLPPPLAEPAALAGNAIDAFGAASTLLLSLYRKEVIEEQFRLTRLADAAIQIFAMVCALSRSAKALQEHSQLADYELHLAKLVCYQGSKTIDHCLSELDKSADGKCFDLIQSVSSRLLQQGDVVCPSPLGF
ncbi:unnamed protein product [Dicrocoelium dendriticum]|nr:unnamed protein product [Dicrocoelium dendriticum]